MDATDRAGCEDGRQRVFGHQFDSPSAGQGGDEIRSLTWWN